jgi:hypothetical protein
MKIIIFKNMIKFDFLFGIISYFTDYISMDIKVMDNIWINTINRNKKKVTFNNITKVNDGTSYRCKLYYMLIKDYFNNKVKSPNDIVSKYIENDRQLLAYFFIQVIISLMKLRIIEKNISKTKFKLTNIVVLTKDNDEEEAQLLLKWDTILLKMIAFKKCYKEPSIGILRHGSRDFIGSLSILHIPYLCKLAIMLIKARKIV